MRKVLQINNLNLKYNNVTSINRILESLLDCIIFSPFIDLFHLICFCVYKKQFLRFTQANL